MAGGRWHRPSPGRPPVGGGIQDGERRVTAGQYETGLRATEDPLDVIYETAWDAPAADR